MLRITFPTAFMASTGFPSSASRQHNCRYLLAHHSSEMPSPVGFVIRSSASQPLGLEKLPPAERTALSASEAPSPSSPPIATPCYPLLLIDLFKFTPTTLVSPSQEK